MKRKLPTKHPQTELWLDDKCSIFVDEKIKHLINTMLNAGIVTLYSCQGEMTYKDMTGPGASSADFAYVLFQHDATSSYILNDILQNFPPLKAGRRFSFMVDYRNYRAYRPRVCIRFPQNYIDELEQFIFINHVFSHDNGAYS